MQVVVTVPENVDYMYPFFAEADAHSLEITT